MKKQILFSIIFMLMISSVFATTVTRTMNSRVSPNEDMTVTLQISDATPGNELAVRDNMPFVVKEWTITGAEEEKQETLSDYETGKYSWVFTPTTSSPKITYTMTVGSVGTYDFSGVYFDKSGMGNINQESGSISSVTVREITCGDSYCEGSETYQTCPSDCEAPTQQQPDEQEPVEEPKEYDMWLYIIAVLVIVFILYSFIKNKPTKKRK